MVLAYKLVERKNKGVLARRNPFAIIEVANGSS